MSSTHGDRKLARPKQKVKQNRCSGVRSPCHLEISLHPTENSQRQSHGNGQHTNDPWKRTRRSRTRLRDPQVPGRKSRPPGAHGSPAEPGRRHTEELTTETLRGTPNDRRTVPTHGIGGGKTGHPIPDTTTRDGRARSRGPHEMAWDPSNTRRSKEYHNDKGEANEYRDRNRIIRRPRTTDSLPDAITNEPKPGTESRGSRHGNGYQLGRAPDRDCNIGSG
jgi:hypothetical protein